MEGSVGVSECRSGGQRPGEGISEHWKRQGECCVVFPDGPSADGCGIIQSVTCAALGLSFTRCECK